MGIESDQLVYDYLSRVGDLAQRQQLSSGARMRLVSTLRGEIERQRGTDGSDTPAVVRRILGRLGTPDELVAAAAGQGDATAPLPRPRAGTDTGAAEVREMPRPRLGALRKDASRKGASEGPGPSPEAAQREARPAAGESARPAARKPRPEEPDVGPGVPDAGPGVPVAGPGVPDGEPVPGWPSASAPHMAGLGAEGEAGVGPEWWQAEAGPFGGGPGALDTAVPGFVGGLSPELLRPPVPPRPVEEDPQEPAEERDGEEEAVTPPRRRLRLRPRRRTPAAVAVEEATGPRFAHPLLLLAAALLVVGAVLGSWLALAGGWLLAYSSRRFSRAEAKWVAMGLPGLVVAGAFVWLWGRMEGRWGAPIAEGAMGDAIADVWPVVVRTAAVASALYLVWRSRRLGR